MTDREAFNKWWMEHSISSSSWDVWKAAWQAALASRKPLTKDELLNILHEVDTMTQRLPYGYDLFARSIETAHGIKEEGK